MVCNLLYFSITVENLGCLITERYSLNRLVTCNSSSVNRAWLFDTQYYFNIINNKYASTTFRDQVWKGELAFVAWFEIGLGFGEPGVTTPTKNPLEVLPGAGGGAYHIPGF